MNKIRYAVVGLGHIAQVAVLPAFRHAGRNSVLAALVTGDPKKADLLSRRYHVETCFSYDQYDALLSSGAIDAVYLALPNHLHEDFAIRALEASIHVLCEKPLALTSSSCARMIDAAERGGVRLMTAYRVHFDPANIAAAELCRDGTLGDLKIFTSAFSYPLTDSTNIRLSARSGGGPLWDIGIYCVNACRYLFGENPREVLAMAGHSDDPRFDEVEESISAMLRFSEDRLGVFTCSFNAVDAGYYEMYGTCGKLRLDNAYEYAMSRRLKYEVEGKKVSKLYKKIDQFAAELLAFSDGIQKNSPLEPSGIEGSVDVAIIEALYRSAEERRAIELPELQGAKRAVLTEDMASSIPPVSKPSTVHSSSPSGD